MKEIMLGLGALALNVGGMMPQKKAITYSQTIRPIIAAKCLPCHSKGSQFGPFDLSSYEEIRSRIELIRTQVLSQSMPPVWAHSDFGKFANVEQVTDDEAVMLQEWIRLKMPIGPPIREVAKRFPKDESGPKPVTSLTFGKQTKSRPEGLPYWSVLSSPLPQKGGRIERLVLLPSNQRVIRYAVVAIVPKDMKIPLETSGSLDLDSKYLVGTWAPGYPGIALPNGFSRIYGPNQKIVVQVHYRPTGRPENASFKIEVYKPSRNSTREPVWITMDKPDLTIPAGKSEVVELTKVLTNDLTLLTVFPEARFYAGRVQLVYKASDGMSKTLFDNMRWDPYWIGNFSYRQPVLLPKGGTLIGRFYYDNDEFCRINEGKKPKPVKAGSGAGDEVCRMHLLIAHG